MRRKNRTPKKVVYVNKNMKATCTTTMLRTLKFYQNTTHLLVAKLPFSRLVREIFSLFGGNFRVRFDAMQALQVAAETYLTDLFVDANVCAAHAKRVTIMPTDIKLVLDIRSVRDPGYYRSN